MAGWAGLAELAGGLAIVDLSCLPFLFPSGSAWSESGFALALALRCRFGSGLGLELGLGLKLGLKPGLGP